MPELSAKPKIVVICGPTGVGKTALAIAAADHFGGEIVGADSMQIYRFMDIGTAKPTIEEQRRARHHMIDIIDPDRDFDAARYGRVAGDIVDQLCGQSRLPIVAGGTGLYIKALIYGLAPQAGADETIRHDLKSQACLHGPAMLHQRLAVVDPSSAARIHPNDTFRIIRALEVFDATGRPLSEVQGDHGFAAPRYNALTIGLTLPRQTLYARIDQRVDQMVADGFVKEVRGLLARGFGRDLKSMQSLGYRHVAAHLQGELTLEEALRIMKRDTRRYAKRQLTWFGAIPDIVWMHPRAIGDCLAKITGFRLKPRE